MNDIRGKMVEYRLLYAQQVDDINKKINQLLELDEGWQLYSVLKMTPPKESGCDFWSFDQEMAKFEKEEE